MFAFLPRWLRVPLALLLTVLNVLIHGAVLFALTLLKLLLPVPALRRGLSATLATIGESWIGVNSLLIDAFTRIRWQVEGLQGLDPRGSYLVLCNHQSWVDIPVLQKLLNRRIPLLRFFLKQELIWVPIMGLAWWALDFPFMKRYSKEKLERHPELRGKDMEATRRACEKFRQLPVAVMNFVEGTRFTPAKHAQQASPYRHLLRPRAGGVAFVLEAMEGALQSILDITIVYPHGPHTTMDLIAGRIPEVRVYLRQRPIAPDLHGSYERDAAFREHFQQWINDLWREKDAQIERMLAAAKLAHGVVEK